MPGGERIVLRDDGVAPDREPGDAIYSARWTPLAAGEYLLRFGDGSGGGGGGGTDDTVAVRVQPGEQPALFSPERYHAGVQGGTIVGIAIGDLNGDGRRDVAALTWRNDPPVVMQVHVLLGQPDGTLAAIPVSYPSERVPRRTSRAAWRWGT